MSIMTCDCEKPTPQQIGGVFCTTCGGFIETNNDARTKELAKPKHPFKWHEEKKPVQVPILNGDIVLADVRVKAVMVWSTEIIKDVDEDDVPEYTSGWVMEIPDQKVVYKDQNFINVGHAMLEKEKPNSSIDIPKGDLVHRFMSDSDIEILKEHRDLMEDVRTGDYNPDSFTNQPIQILIHRLLNK